MIIECPECSTQYDLPVDLPGEGRKVRCASCATIWHAHPDDAVLPRSDETEVEPEQSQSSEPPPDQQDFDAEPEPIPAIAPEIQQEEELEFRDSGESADNTFEPDISDQSPDDVLSFNEAESEFQSDDQPKNQDDIDALFGAADIDDDEASEFESFTPENMDLTETESDLTDQLQGFDESDIGEFENEPEEIREEEPFSVPEPVIPPASDDTTDASFIQETARSNHLTKDINRNRAFIAAGWGALAATILVIFSVGYFNREGVVRAIPGMAGLYKGLGIVVNVRGLEFHEVSYSWEIDSGRPVLQVSGTILNITNKPQKVPTVVFALRDNQGSELFHWAKNVYKEPLDAGKRAPFLARIPSPPNSVRSLQVRFAKAR